MWLVLVLPYRGVTTNRPKGGLEPKDKEVCIHLTGKDQPRLPLLSHPCELGCKTSFTFAREKGKVPTRHLVNRILWDEPSIALIIEANRIEPIRP